MRYQRFFGLIFVVSVFSIASASAQSAIECKQDVLEKIRTFDHSSNLYRGWETHVRNLEVTFVALLQKALEPTVDNGSRNSFSNVNSPLSTPIGSYSLIRAGSIDELHFGTTDKSNFEALRRTGLRVELAGMILQGDGTQWKLRVGRRYTSTLEFKATTILGLVDQLLPSNLATITREHRHVSLDGLRALEAACESGATSVQDPERERRLEEARDVLRQWISEKIPQTRI